MDKENLKHALEAEEATAVGAEAASPGVKRAAHSSLQKLQECTQVVVDSAKLADAQKCVDATTNPSLILAAATCGDYEEDVAAAIAAAKEKGISAIVDQLVLTFVSKLVATVPGLVSVEVDPELSFDQQATEERARELIKFFAENGINKDRLLVKVPATWEGIRAAETLEKEGIRCNLTLIFSFYQALACADAGVFLISPFVGRITDWYKAANKYDAEKDADGTADPGVIAVTRIYNYYKKHGVSTIVMGASFRNELQVKNLCGCDKLTIPPAIIDKLDKELAPSLSVKLTPEGAQASQEPKLEPLDEKTFRWHMNEDQMATEKLSDGIRRFAADWIKLKDYIKTRL